MHAAAAHDCASTMNTGSMRIEPYAIWLALKHTGTYRLLHSAAFGISARYETGYGPKPPFSTLPSFFTIPFTTRRSQLCESIVYAAMPTPSVTVARLSQLACVIT